MQENLVETVAETVTETVAETVPNVVWPIYTPLIWLVIFACILLGLAGLFAPDALRAIFARFKKNRPIRILGLFLMGISGMIFANASGTQYPLAIRTVSVLFFLDGGVSLFIPTIVIILVEWLMERKKGFYRFVGLLFFALAGFFYLAAQAAEPISDVIEGIEETIEDTVGGGKEAPSSPD